ncbi:MAG: PfkB family carbohydrate kinase [Methanobacteriaceae archaeon]|nr:PfkB family carbohydrate kinase [Methanobacteriaceae archaeon]
MKVILLGPLSCDIIIKNGNRYKSIGGPVFYQSGVFKSLGINLEAVITLSNKDKNLLDSFPEKVHVHQILTKETMQFQNIYPDHDPNHRIQKAIIPKNPIKYQFISGVDFLSADALLLGPLSPYDIPLETLDYLYSTKIPIYLGGQGYLRHLDSDKIILKQWKNYKHYLKYVECLFIDENEARVILDGKITNLRDIIVKLALSGPKEVVITCGSRGALIYSRIEDSFYKIPAYKPETVKDPTGLGDTFMAAYVAKKFETENIDECGRFAAALSCMKLEKNGFFNYSSKEIKKRLKRMKVDL